MVRRLQLVAELGERRAWLVELHVAELPAQLGDSAGRRWSGLAGSGPIAIVFAAIFFRHLDFW